MFRERAAKSLTLRALAGVGESSPQREVLAVGDRERLAQLAELFGVPAFEFLELRGQCSDRGRCGLLFAFGHLFRSCSVVRALVRRSLIFVRRSGWL